MPSIITRVPPSRGDRFNRGDPRSNPFGRLFVRPIGGPEQGMDGVFPTGNLKFYLPLTDKGAGAVNLIPNVGLNTPTFTRATTAATRLSSGLWNLAVASGTARSYFDANGVYRGFLSELAATQILTNSRDLSQVAWVKTNTTAALTSVGLDGTANTASRVTATLANGTCFQTSTAAASTHTFSAYVKRVTGVGTITLNVGGASLDITALINSSTYTLVQLGTDATLNAVCGFTISTNADAIDVDATQLELGAFATSPLLDNGTRNADVLTYPLAGNALTTQGTLYTEYYAEHTFAALSAMFGHDDGTAANANFIQTSAANVGKYAGVDTSAAQWAILDATAYVAGVQVKQAGRYILNATQEFRNGVAGTADSVCTMPVTTTIIVGNSAGINQPGACIKNCRIWGEPLTDGQLTLMTT